MVDAQNERSNGKNRRRGRRRNRGQQPAESETATQIVAAESESSTPSEPAPMPKRTLDAPLVRPADIAPPTVRTEEYCVHHMASITEQEPMQTRTNMTTLRHLQVDHFGEATLYCDCLHNGPHEWPPTMQRLQTAIELDQFLADSTSDA